MTIGFDNKNGYWKSSYGFATTCFASLNKRFVSFAIPSSASSSICYLHSEDSAFNTFFDASQSSIIAVSFNDLVSNNKVFKSLSIEGGRIPETVNTLNFFRANSDNIPDKTTPSGGRLREKGGITYGHIGSISRDTSANVSIVGVVTDISDYNGDIGGRGLKLLNPNTSNVTTSSLFFLISSGNPSNIYGLTQNGLSNLGQASNYSITYDQLNPENDGSGLQVIVDDYITSDVITNNTINLNIPADVVSPVFNSANDGSLLLFALTPSSINGEQPKGQYADAWFVLPANGGFELNAINLNYETVSADHSK